jgi:nucleoside-diphosphate-sugar epimerase
MKILVTGASGFVGGYLVRELLRRGHAVTGLVRREQSVRTLATEGMHVAVGDMSVPATLREPMHGQDVVIHLAAVVGKDPGDWENHLAQGVRGTENVITAAIEAHVPRFVHLSSCVVYKAPRDTNLVTEESPVEDRIEPWNHYLRQKVLCEDIVRAHAGRIGLTIIRPPTVIGPGDPGFAPLMINISRSPLGALAKDDGHHFPVVAVEDLADGIAAATERSEAVGRTYNLASARPMTKAQLMAHLAAAGLNLTGGSSARATIVAIAAAGLNVVDGLLSIFGDAIAPRRRIVERLEDHAHRRAQPDLVVDISRARRELGFKGETDLTRAIHKTIAWSTAQ